jgi:hypothetical protein
VYARRFLEARFWRANFFLVFEIYFWGGDRSPAGMTEGKARSTAQIQGSFATLRMTAGKTDNGKGKSSGNGKYGDSELRSE